MKPGAEILVQRSNSSEQSTIFQGNVSDRYFPDTVNKPNTMNRPTIVFSVGSPSLKRGRDFAQKSVHLITIILNLRARGVVRNFTEGCVICSRIPLDLVEYHAVQILIVPKNVRAVGWHTIMDLKRGRENETET